MRKFLIIAGLVILAVVFIATWPKSNPTDQSQTAPSVPSRAVPAQQNSDQQAHMKVNQIPNVDDSESELKMQMASYQEHLSAEFDPFSRLKRHVIGQLHLKTDTFEADLTMDLDEPRPWGETNKSVYPLRFERSEHSNGISTAVSLRDQLSTENGQIYLHLYTPLMISVFKVAHAEAAHVERQTRLEEFADIIVDVDPAQTKKTTTVYARRHFDIDETPVAIGTFRYKIVRF